MYEEKEVYARDTSRKFREKDDYESRTEYLESRTMYERTVQE
jgi:hypothetical protein